MLHCKIITQVGSWATNRCSESSKSLVFRHIFPLTKAYFSAVTERQNIRNIGISAHIDSGKTTLTERILFYTGRIGEIHEVRGKDGVGAKMDSMELEREKGITIQSAATYCTWGENQINIIDTPGHVDFTIEVERALRVLDGAVLVVCSVGGVQSQSITVDRQMKRYNVPRVVFINKLDRMGADPQSVIQQIRNKLKIRCHAVQIPIGLEAAHCGVVDVIRRQAIYFEGNRGEKVTIREPPESLKQSIEESRQSLIESVAEVDEELADTFLEGHDPTVDELTRSIRRATITNLFAPVFMGSAFKNRGVQTLLDGVVDYLPSPDEITNYGIDVSTTRQENKIKLCSDSNLPLVALAFKLEEGRFGQLTYVRIYQGLIKKGSSIVNMTAGKKVKVPRLVRMHSNEMEDVTVAGAGEVIAMFGIDCATGDTFTNGEKILMSSMHVPESVMSLAIRPITKEDTGNFSKALNRFTKEDPTFRTYVDPDSAETIVCGMGELHLEIYLERMKREYKINLQVGAPRVNYREAITQRAAFDYTHKKQSGGQGQYGKVCGYIEPILESDSNFEFINQIVGNSIAPNFVQAIEKGFREALNTGVLLGHPVQNVRVVLQDGASHAVDSSELAFKIAAMHAFRQGATAAGPVIKEPMMRVQVTIPTEFHGNVIGNLNKRKGTIIGSEISTDDTVVEGLVPLSNMFGYSTELRSMTQGKGEFTMEYELHEVVSKDVHAQLIKEQASQTRRR
mmetsp:Transcript_20780/g.70731  ORF Transcript_20780/g.70731 Transcript_20780/m.70731 type:complete len:737 (-) Transcript_20780:3507-5717(-)